ncbi:MarR family transcriptional regulator [Streptomyces sp. NPDC026206]|uniref:MarR family winged helix-turn-helix transcriptional regulator n=1 Tax=Streptomyces sp. NPDC026206 TaxID=3157089 RepID=UPI0033C0327F
MDTENGTRWLSDEEQATWRAHLDVSRLLMHQLERDLQPFGLTNNDYEILVNLSESEDHRMRMSDLATATLQSKSRLSHQITRMENAGLVRRENCESDRRGLFAVLTEQGWETMRKVAPHHVASVRQHFIDLLSPGELKALHASLTPVAQHLRSTRGRG